MSISNTDNIANSQNNLSASSNDAGKSDDGYGDIAVNECQTLYYSSKIHSGTVIWQ